MTGEKIILKTEDQGETWSSLNIDSSYYYRSIYMISKNIGFAVGSDGVVAKTTDGGLNWSTRKIGHQDFRDIDFISDSIGFIAGGGHYYKSDSIGLILRTKDQGQTWETIALSQSRLNSFQFIDSVAYVVGNYGNIFKNSNYFDLIDYREPVILDSSFELYPNPSKDRIHIRGFENKSIDIEVFDSSGNLLTQKLNFSKNQLNIAHLKSGTYIMRVVSGGKAHMSKFNKVN